MNDQEEHALAAVGHREQVSKNVGHSLAVISTNGQEAENPGQSEERKQDQSCLQTRSGREFEERWRWGVVFYLI